jgi:hypothetical protein
MNKPQNSTNGRPSSQGGGNLFAVVRLDDNSESNKDTLYVGNYINLELRSRGPIRADLIEAIKLAYHSSEAIPVELGISVKKLLIPRSTNSIDTQAILKVLADLIADVHSCDGTAQICTEEAEQVLAAAKQTFESKS